MRTYDIVCPSCRGSGRIPDPAPVSTTLTIECPACKGTKVVTVHETGEE